MEISNETKTQEQQDLHLLKTVITTVLSTIDKTWRALQKVDNEQEKKEIDSTANKIIQENILKITNILRDRIPDHLREKVLSYFEFEDQGLEYKAHKSDPNQKENIWDYVYYQIIGNIIIGVPSLDNLVKFSKKERDDLLNSWKPFFSGTFPLYPGSFLLAWPLPKKPKPVKTVEFSKSNPTTVASVQEFIKDIPDGIKLKVKYLGDSRMQNWDAHVAGFEIVENSILVTVDYQNEITITIEDLKQFFSDKNESQRVFIKRNGIDPSNFRYMDYYENDKVQIMFY